MREVKKIGQKKQGKRNYMFGLFFCEYCSSNVEKVWKDGNVAMFCSHKCYAKNRDKRGAYKEFVMIGKYKYIYKPNHPNAIGSKSLYVAEHRIKVEENIGRYLTELEVIHHINEDTLDNNIENLKIMSPSEHSSLHCNFKKKGVEL